MLEYFSLTRFLICGFGIFMLGSTSTGRVELHCDQVNEGKKYCKIIKGERFWSESSYNFNLQNVTLKPTESNGNSYRFNIRKFKWDEEKYVYHGSPYTLIFNSEKPIQFAIYDDLEEAQKVEQKVESFLGVNGEKYLSLAYIPSGTGIIFIVGIFSLLVGLFGAINSSSDGNWERNYNYDDVP